MREKNMVIIESGIKLFARKGYSSTSIQEIATESGISKGAFYLHFKSKDELLLAILEFIFNTIHSSIYEFENQNVSAREKFIKQLSALFGTFIKHKEFLIMLSKEQAIPRNEEIKALIFRNHQKTHYFLREGLVAIYGQEMETYSIDLALIIEGMFHSYLSLLLFDPLEFNLEELTSFILRRMDSIVNEISREPAFLTDEKVEQLLKKSNDFFEGTDMNIIIQKMKNKLKELGNQESLLISMEVLEEEIGRTNPRTPVIKGMLSNFKDIKEVEAYTKAIADFYGI